MESTLRSMVKALSWRITGSGATFLISFLISGNFTVAGSIASVQLITHTVLYFIHERIWNQIKWQKNS